MLHNRHELNFREKSRLLGGGAVALATCLLAACLLVVASLTSCNKTLPPTARNSYHPYSVQHATLHFEYFGDTRGTEDLFVDSFGLVEAHDMNFEHISPTHGLEPTQSYSVRRGADVAIVDSFTGRRLSVRDSVLDSVMHLSSPPSPEQAFEDHFSVLGYHRTGTTQKIGVTVNTWQLGQDPIFLYEWHGVIVGRETHGRGGGGTELRLISIDSTSPVDPKYFIVPDAFKNGPSAPSGPATPKTAPSY